MVDRGSIKKMYLEEEFAAKIAALGDSAHWQKRIKHLSLELPRSHYNYGIPRAAWVNDHQGHITEDTYPGNLELKQ